jgi:hypothetical protein
MAEKHGTSIDQYLSTLRSVCIRFNARDLDKARLLANTQLMLAKLFQ